MYAGPRYDVCELLRVPFPTVIGVHPDSAQKSFRVSQLKLSPMPSW